MREPEREMGRVEDVMAILKLEKSTVYSMASRGTFPVDVYQGRGMYCLTNLYKHIDRGTLFTRDFSSEGVNQATLVLQKQLKGV